jgi:microcompartment protein CcmK/EutM
MVVSDPFRGVRFVDMRLARVVGQVVSTQKNPKLNGAKLLLVQPVTADGDSAGTVVLAVDAVQAGVGDTVLLVIEGRAAVSALRRRGAPVDAAVVGVVDQVDFDLVHE